MPQWLEFNWLNKFDIISKREKKKLIFCSKAATTTTTKNVSRERIIIDFNSELITMKHENFHFSIKNS